jgi:hypothetical protein
VQYMANPSLFCDITVYFWQAEVAELADAHGLGPCVFDMRVRLSPSAPSSRISLLDLVILRG